MNKLIIICFLLLFTSAVFGAEKKKSSSSKDVMETKTGDNNVTYKYVKHQEFDFENLDVQGDPGSALGDITVSARSQKDFDNKLPYKKNFDPEIKKALERVR